MISDHNVIYIPPPPYLKFGQNVLSNDSSLRTFANLTRKIVVLLCRFLLRVPLRAVFSFDFDQECFDAVEHSQIRKRGWTWSASVTASQNIFLQEFPTTLLCTLFCDVVLTCFTIRQHERHFELPKQQFCWPSDGF